MRTDHKAAVLGAGEVPAGGGRRAVLLFLAIAAVLFGVQAVSSLWLPDRGNHVIPPFSGWRWIQAWAQWDSGWYAAIADGGYGYVKGKQSTIAFFPAYPLTMRLVTVVVGNAYAAGFVVTLASGAVATRLLFGWLRARMNRAASWAALGLLLVYPYAFFLYGAVYPTAFFLMTLLAAFVLLEHDHPWLAGLAGALAAAARPTGVILVAALAVRAFERRRELDDGRPVWRDAGVLLSGLGIAAFCLYQWRKFDDPIAFITIQEAWDQESGLHTWLKFRFFEDLGTLPERHVLGSLSYLAHPVLTFAALALVPRVYRRFGYGYGTYALLAVLVPAVSTKNFFGMGRYLMAAFPVFAVAGELLAERPRLARVVYPVAGLGLLALTAAYSQAIYLS